MNSTNMRMQSPTKKTEARRNRRRIVEAWMTRFRIAERAASSSSGNPGLPANVVFTMPGCLYFENLGRIFMTVSPFRLLLLSDPKQILLTSTPSSLFIHKKKNMCHGLLVEFSKRIRLFSLLVYL